MEKLQGQLPYHSPALAPSPAPTLFLGILEVPTPAKKRATPKPKSAIPPERPLASRRVMFLDIRPKNNA